MQLEQVKPNKPSFLRVVLLSAAFIIFAFIIAAIIVTWHRKNHPTPFTKHPVSKVLSGPPSAVLS